MVIEVDGVQHADSTSDPARDVWLRGQGFTVLRFWNDEVRFQIDMVMDTIDATLEDSSG